MTLPIPPSDSLYKFTAIGGLILTVLSLYVPQYMRTQINLEWIEGKAHFEKLKIDEALLEHEADVLKAENQMMLSFFKAFVADEKGEVKDEKWLKLFYERERHFDSKRSQFLEQKQELLHQFQQAHSESERLKLLKQQLETIVWTAVATFFTGVIMMVFGFWNWYFKFQIYQDRIIKAQAEQWTTPQPEREREEIPG